MRRCHRLHEPQNVERYPPRCEAHTVACGAPWHAFTFLVSTTDVDVFSRKRRQRAGGPVLGANARDGSHSQQTPERSLVTREDVCLSCFGSDGHKQLSTSRSLSLPSSVATVDRQDRVGWCSSWWQLDEPSIARESGGVILWARAAIVHRAASAMTKSVDSQRIARRGLSRTTVTVGRRAVQTSSSIEILYRVMIS